MNSIDTVLAQFKPDDTTVRFCDILFGTVPLAPPQVRYATLEQAITALYPAASPTVRARASQLADSPEVKKALWWLNALDTGDSGIAIYSGLRSALSLFGGNRGQALETDPQQGLDATLKLMGVAYTAGLLFPRGDRVQAFHTCPTGKLLTFYWAAIEVALPFTDNLVQGGAGFVSGLLDRYGAGAAQKLAAHAPEIAQGTWREFIAPLERAVAEVGPHAQAIAGRIQSYAPAVAQRADQVAGAIATAADALPVYGYLGGRLAAEAVVLRASRGE
jgi:hypothetical protein